MRVPWSQGHRTRICRFSCDPLGLGRQSVPERGGPPVYGTTPESCGLRQPSALQVRRLWRNGVIGPTDPAAAQRAKAKRADDIPDRGSVARRGLAPELHSRLERPAVRRKEARVETLGWRLREGIGRPKGALRERKPRRAPCAAHLSTEGDS